MPTKLASPDINTLRNRIDLARLPFSDRGSRLLVYQAQGQSRLYIKLAERLTSLEAGIEAYLRRPPFISALSLLDGVGQTLDFELISYPHILLFKTRIGEFGLVFKDDHTLAFGTPPGQTAGISFHVSPQMWKVHDNGGLFKSVRNLAYQTNGETYLNKITPDRGGYTVEFMVNPGEDVAIVINIEESPLGEELLPFSVLRDAAEVRWADWFSKAPPVLEKYVDTYAYAWWIMGNNLVRPKGHIAYEAMMPSKTNYVGLWLWDSALHALAYRYVDPELARNQIRVMLSYQLPDGMLPDAVYDEGVISEIDHPIRAEVTKPPILAWAALKLHETSPDIGFLQEIYVPLVRWNAWWFSMNDDDADGLAQYNHPYSSGLDDNPLWDYGMPVESPDLNTYLCVQMGSLAMISEALGMDSESGMWRRRAAAIVRRMIDDFWDEEAGIFRAQNENGPIQVVTPFNLYPLWTGQLHENIRERLLSHLTNPEMFWGKRSIPSVARNDPHFDPATMWRGPVWANVNYFFVEALHQIGRHDLADELTLNTLEMIMSQDGIFEYYNAEDGTPPAKAATGFGWTAAVFIDLAIQASDSLAQSSQEGEET